MAEVILTTGNHAAAYAVKAAKAQVIAAYPITPQSPTVERLSELVESGELKAEFICVESEHTAMAALIGASATGVRTFTATSAHGLALMHEMLHWASGARLPIVMYVANRAMAPPWSIWCDHQDTISQRDTGWMQFYVEDNQEIFDTILMAYKIAEDREVLLPAMICADGFTLSHMTMPVEVPDQKDVDDFLPPYEPAFKLDDPENPVTHGAPAMPNVPFSDWYTEYRFLMQESMIKAKEKIKEVCGEFKRRFGRFHGDLVERYRCDDAEVVLVSMGSLATQAEDVVDAMCDEGYSVGALKLRVFRPFPVEEIQELAKHVKAFAVIDRNMSFGHVGAGLMEIKAALCDVKDRPIVKGYVMGLGGRDVTPSEQRLAVQKTFKDIERGWVEKSMEWIGLRA
ncbi:MAG: Ketoisovalerate oxidoreductase subunit VorA [Candidatus Bathyarchaeota archaeon BA1]|nr:MAG: Ketoisovalerate oxidoreductase subunit VorA [Candidatus Bathyarchaeota archaeon BA1]